MWYLAYAKIPEPWIRLKETVNDKIELLIHVNENKFVSHLPVYV